VSKLETIQTVKVLYKEHEFSVIPAKTLSIVEKNEMLGYVKNIGDIAFIVDEEFYFDEGAFFNLTMKYCDKYIII
jgi:hypothetical protein